MHKKGQFILRRAAPEEGVKDQRHSNRRLQGGNHPFTPLGAGWKRWEALHHLGLGVGNISGGNESVEEHPTQGSCCFTFLFHLIGGLGTQFELWKGNGFFETRMHFEHRTTTFGALNLFFYNDTVFSQGLHQMVFLLGCLREKIHSFKSRVHGLHSGSILIYLFFKVSCFNRMEQKVNISRKHSRYNIYRGFS